MPISQKRIGEFLYETLVFLSAAESTARDELIEHLEQTLAPTPEEAQVGSRGRPDWLTRCLWYTVGMVKAGWITKDGRGVWAATDAGRAALGTYPTQAPCSRPTMPRTRRGKPVPGSLSGGPGSSEGPQCLA